MGFLRLVILTSVCIGSARADVYQPIGYDPCVCTPGVHVQGYVHAPIQFAAPPFITMQPSYALATPMMSVDYSARPNLMTFPVPNDSLPPAVALPGERFVPVPGGTPVPGTTTNPDVATTPPTGITDPNGPVDPVSFYNDGSMVPEPLTEPDDFGVIDFSPDPFVDWGVAGIRPPDWMLTTSINPRGSGMPFGGGSGVLSDGDVILTPESEPTPEPTTMMIATLATGYALLRRRTTPNAA